MASKYGDISQASWLQICPFCKSRRFCQNTLFRSPKGFLKGEKFTLTCCSTINHKNRNKPSLASTILSKKKKTSEIQVGNITVKFDNPPTLKAMSPSLSLGCIHCLAICLAMSCLEKYLDDMLIGYVERRGQWKRMDVY